MKTGDAIWDSVVYVIVRQGVKKRGGSKDSAQRHVSSCSQLTTTEDVSAGDSKSIELVAIWRTVKPLRQGYLLGRQIGSSLRLATA